MPISFPHRVEDNQSFLNYRSERGRVLYGEDVYVGYRYYDKVRRPALFSFGHGLSYTTFDYNDLEISSANSTVNVRLSVTNTGDREGAEVIQVYVTACTPSIGRPIKELQGFQKVWLEPGETKQIEIGVDKKLATSFWDEGRDQWIVEKGEYRILVGNSSRCKKFLEAPFEVEETYWWTEL